MGALRRPRGLPHTRPLHTRAAHVGVRPGIWYAPGNRSGDLSSGLCLSYRWINRNRFEGGGGGAGVGSHTRTPPPTPGAVHRVWSGV